jgi:hypothetical protein
MNRLVPTVCCWLSLAAGCSLTADAQVKFKTYDDAMSAGARGAAAGGDRAAGGGGEAGTG